MTVGAAVTVNTVAAATEPSPFVTVTVRAPVAAVAPTVMFAVSVVLLTYVVELTVIWAPNEAEREPPPMNPVPVSVMSWFVAPRPRDAGAAEVRVGAGSTVKMPMPVSVPPSRFVTVTSRAPVAAPPLMLTFAVTCVGLSTVVELTVMPVPENATVAPLAKFVPVTWML